MATTGLGEFKKDTRSHFSLKDKKNIVITLVVAGLIVAAVVTGIFLMSDTPHFKSLVSFVDSWGASSSSSGESDRASRKVAKKDEVDGMPPPGAAPDLNFPGSDPKVAPKVLAERRHPPGTLEPTKTAVAATAAAKASVAAPTASAVVVAAAPASVFSDIDRLKKEVDVINRWREDQSIVVLNLARDVGEMKKASASAEISAMAARLTEQESKTKRLEGGQRRIESGQNEIVGRMARMDEERIAAVRQGLAVKLARNPEAILSASGPAETKRVLPTADAAVSRDLQPAVVSGGCIVNCGRKGK